MKTYPNRLTYQLFNNINKDIDFFVLFTHHFGASNSIVQNINGRCKISKHKLNNKKNNQNIYLNVFLISFIEKGEITCSVYNINFNKKKKTSTINQGNKI